MIVLQGDNSQPVCCFLILWQFSQDGIIVTVPPAYAAGMMVLIKVKLAILMNEKLLRKK